MTFPLRKIFFAVCLIALVLCLGAGYELSGQWIGVVISLVTGPAWLFARKYSTSILPLTCLLISVCLAVVGKINGGSSFLMICGSGFALATWDLLLLDGALTNNSSGEQTRQFEIRHLQSLGAALGSGLVVISLGYLIRLQIPFVVLLLSIALVIFGLDRVWGYIKKTG
ncbi:MAG: hypothetical protein HY865_17835 [Chloroflexi bacterium]|nr:hypothetical protein [Chloroflexota bacterium]